MNGVLEKKGRGIFAGWQARTFELDGATAELAYTDAKKGGGDGGKRRVVGRVVGARAAEAKGVRTYCFDVQLEGARGTLHCSAESAEERQRWLGALQRAGGMGAAGAAAAAADARDDARGEAATDATALAEAAAAATAPPSGGGVGAAVADVAAATVDAVGGMLLPLQPAARVLSSLLRSVRQHAGLDPALRQVVLVLTSLQRCLDTRGERLAGDDGALAALLEASLRRAAAEAERIDGSAQALKRLGAEALRQRLRKLLDETAQLAGFVTFAMAAEAPTQAELQRCLDDAAAQSAAQLAAIGSQLDVLVSKQRAVEGKEAALEQNRIDPADVERTGEVIGKGANGVVTKVGASYCRSAQRRESSPLSPHLPRAPLLLALSRAHRLPSSALPPPPSPLRPSSPCPPAFAARRCATGSRSPP